VKNVSENDSPSPDRNGNPLLFFFKTIKIAVDSWISSLNKDIKKPPISRKAVFVLFFNNISFFIIEMIF
jgi:hypothetical protein